MRRARAKEMALAMSSAPKWMQLAMSPAPKRDAACDAIRHKKRSHPPNELPHANKNSAINTNMV